MKWTHKLPTQAGWFWSRFIPQGKHCEAVTVILHITRTRHKKLRVNGQSLESLCLYGERLWAGPITPPFPSEIED